MGIKTFWTIVSGAEEKTELQELSGQRLAIDLAGWIVQNNQCKAMKGQVTKPHLRNLFFRASALLAAGVEPLFVLDGSAPEIKRDTMNQRRRAEAGDGQLEIKSTDRRRLKAVMNECKALLEALGLPSISSTGEAEALCALLELKKHVDACVSDDSDIFCYGARNVLRKFAISGKTCSVERYRMEKLETCFNLSKDRITFLAVFLGCDFFPTGVPKIGKETVMRMFKLWPEEWNAIAVLRFWVSRAFAPMDYCKNCENDGHCDLCRRWGTSVTNRYCLCDYVATTDELLKIEKSVLKKCQQLELSWWSNEMPKVLCEFDFNQALPVAVQTRQRRPNYSSFSSMMRSKLDWTEDHCLEKFLPILTRWQIDHLGNGGLDIVIQPEQIIKKRVVNFVPALEVEWTVVSAEQPLPHTFKSVEPILCFSKAYPKFVDEFEEKQSMKKTTKSRTKKLTKTKKVAPSQEPKQQKAGAQPQGQKTISAFFTERKKLKEKVPICMKPSVSRSELNDEPQTENEDPNVIEPVTNVGVKSEISKVYVVEDSTFSDTDSDCSDLSFIIEDILSKRLDALKYEDSPKPTGTNKKVLTSTPATVPKVIVESSDVSSEEDLVCQ